MPILLNKKLILANFEEKFFAHFLKRFADFRAIFFCSKSAEMKIYYVIWLWGTNFMKYFFFYLSVKNWSL